MLFKFDIEFVPNKQTLFERFDFVKDGNIEDWDNKNYIKNSESQR